MRLERGERRLIYILGIVAGIIIGYGWKWLEVHHDKQTERLVTSSESGRSER